jgi:hypothetical protein
MINPNTWARTFPRLHELYCEDPTNLDNYFNHPNIELALQSDPPDPDFIQLESILEELDTLAWQEWKCRAADSLSTEKRYGFPLPLFDAFNEARAYVFLKRQGYNDIRFIKPGKKKAKKAPDLLATDSAGCSILLEAKRIHDSDEEIKYLLSPNEHRDFREVRHGLDEALERKLRSTYEKAREQLLAYTGERITRRIVYFCIRLDSSSATQKTVNEIDTFLTSISDGEIESVYVFENRFLL